jgi:hypothetical protein
MRFLGRRWQLFATALGVALAAPVIAAEAQTGKVTGVVTDTETGKPIEGAQVVIQGTTLGGTTNATGRYFIIQVQPGTYTVQARRLGYQSVNATNVVVTIEQTTEQNFKLKSSNQTLQAITVQAEQVPLVPRGQVGSQSVITADQIQSLPVTTIAGVLALQQGFTQVPDNTNIVSLAEEQRSTTPAVRVRGSRGGSTLSMVDGIPINNPLFGNDAVSVNGLAVQQTVLQRGYMDPMYGNALSGVINNALREGGSEVSGSIDYRNSGVPGRLFNSPQDIVNGVQLIRGYLSGPVPGTNSKLRYAVSGQVNSQAARALQYDNDVFTVNNPADLRNGIRTTNVLNPDTRDLASGWQGFGVTQNTNLVGKLTWLATDNTTLKFTAVTGDRARRNYDRRLQPQYRGDPLRLVNNRADSLFVLSDAGNRQSRDMIQPAVRDQGTVYVGTLSQRFGRSNLELRVAQTDFERVTCPFFQGTCIPGPFFRQNFSQGFLSPSPTVAGGDRVPYGGIADGEFGGEKYTSRTVRLDFKSQITDHNELGVGVQYIGHDMVYSDIAAFGTNSGIQPTTSMVYRAKPYEAAAYIQSKIEYDFITIQLGGRFDYGVARGRGFTDPFDPSNGTTARQVCDGATVGGQRLLNAQGQPFGTSGCLASAIDRNTQRPVLLDSATRIAQLDDFSEARARTAFSPRVGVSFPLTEESQVFFNAGRYTMVPLYGNVYRNTGIGTVAGQDPYCAASAVKPGSTECVPNIRQDNPQFVGNPNLLLEQSKAYEVGYSAAISRDYSVQVVVFNRSETGLSGIRPSRAVQDIGSTYDGASPFYQVLVNGDFLASRGLEVQFQRRLRDRWGYDVNYGLSRATTNSRPPERQNEVGRREAASRNQLFETVADVNQPQRFNGSVFFQIRDDAPSLPFDVGRFMKNSRLTITYQWASGFPYTPIRGDAFGLQNAANVADINSGSAPSTQDVGAFLNKQFRINNMNYSAFLQVNNLFDRRNCVQVFVNNGTCDFGLRDFTNRSVGNTGDASTSTAFDQPEFIGARRSVSAGISINF